MVHDEKSLGMLIEPVHHGSVHMRQWREAGHRRMPMAVAIGVDPLCLFCSAISFPSGVAEYDMVGALRESPLEVVRCETIDLEVPADAEIILEGELTVDPADFRPEGPFGEATGHYVSLKEERRPVFHVNCVTHRKDPILTTRYVGAGSPSISTESNAGIAPARTAVLWNQLVDRGVEGLKGIRSFGGGASNITVISIKQSYYGQAKQVAATLWGISGGGKVTVIVDDDVDISDLNKVMIAVANRVRPGEDVQVLKGFPGGSLDPSNHPDILEKTQGVGMIDRLLIDATWPMDWEARPEWGGLKHPPSCLPTADRLEEIRKRWKELGIEE
jgi:4-hydroxy-3-polyprenylbenzoate decarboxylase